MHPAGVTRSMWFGPEVEGDLAASRVLTAFIAARVSDEAVQRAVGAVGVRHFFFTEDFSDWEWLGGLLSRIDAAIPVTIARRNDEAAVAAVLALPFADRLRLMVRAMPTPWASLLRAQDQVSIGRDYNLATFSMSAAVWSSPHDYAEDFE